MGISIGSVVRISGNMYVVTDTHRVSKVIDKQKVLDMVSMTDAQCSAILPYRMDDNGIMWITTYSDEEQVEREVTFVASTVKDYITSRLLGDFADLR